MSYAIGAKKSSKHPLQVFKLNTSLYPSDWNVYDSYGEALLKAGQKEEAIKMYQKSSKLNGNDVRISKRLITIIVSIGLLLLVL